MEAYNFKDLTGMKFGKLTVIKRTCNSKNGSARWICICECGKETIVIGSKLLSDHTKSCGCLKNLKYGLSRTRLYRIWQGMIGRCEDIYKDNYYWYGFRGISICEQWHDFITFYNWAISSGYNDNLTLDRINTNGNYEPSNCRWATQLEQCNNVSTNRHILHKGNIYTVAEFSRLINYKDHTVRNRLRLGWTPEEIVQIQEGKNVKRKYIRIT